MTTATTSQSDLRAPPLNAAGLALRVVASVDASAIGLVRVLDRDLTIGRADDCSLRLNESRVSRLHARIQVNAGRGLARIADESSKNGLRVNGRATQGHVLSDGDVIRIGDSMLVVDAAPTSSDVVPSRNELLAMGTRTRLALEEVHRAAPTDLSVLMQGPSGAGKEVFALELHSRSGRAGRFHAVNCGAIPRDLIEASLFGHRKGAFTGAVATQDGHIRSAHGGTLFLDEVAELSPAAQVALLRVLETREVTPVGSTRSEPVNVRIVAATHQSLRDSVRAGAFRDDLYARLAEWTIGVPALAARRADIPGLVRAVAPTGTTVHPDALEALLIDPWEHNVRGLRAAVRQAVVRAAPTTEVRLPHLPAEIGARVGLAGQIHRGAAPGPFARPSREELLATLEHFEWRVHLVAKHFGKDRRQVYRWMEYAGLRQET